MKQVELGPLITVPWQPPDLPDWPWLPFAVLLCMQLWAAHAVAFFLHEYAHSFVAWITGWKANPFALNYAHPTLKVFLMQAGIDQNVDEGPIFASGHGPFAALIGGAGMVVGNGLLSFPLSRLGYGIARRHQRRSWALFFYWCTVASIGNFIDYVPVRTFTLEGDMGSIQRGAGWSPWAVIAVLGVPIAVAVTYFLLKIEPISLAWLFPDSVPQRTVAVLVTGAALFGFYGAAGLLDGGPVSHRISVVSTCVLLPLITTATWFFVQRQAVLGSLRSR